jgi:hypothetical protein
MFIWNGGFVHSRESELQIYSDVCVFELAVQFLNYLREKLLNFVITFYDIS